MIVTHIMGGVGNQLYQYAIGRYLAYKNNTELKLDITQCVADKSTHHQYYQLGNFNIQENFATSDEIHNLKKVLEKETTPQFVLETLTKTDNIFLSGVWASEIYFEEIGGILRQELTPKNPFGRKSNFWKEKILSAECAVSLHIRHGDYLNSWVRNTFWGKVVPMNYYQICIDVLKKEFPNLTVFVFSDDLKWAKNNFKLDVPIEYVEGCESDVDELFLMSFCKHNITANSTFSFWGAWLNQNPNKKAFSPRDVAGVKLPEQNIFYKQKDFILVFVDFSKNPHIEFPPMLSVILHVENNIGTINFSVGSILSQDIKDYELIIVDSSSDDSGKLCRNFMADEKVSIVKHNHHSTKLSAWNKGLECARGDYVLMLTAMDFIFPQTFNTFAKLLQKHNMRYVQKQSGDYLDYENYDKNYPNIVCSIQNLIEDTNGNVALNGIQNKRFDIKKDNLFDNLRDFTEVQIGNRDKIALLATQRINNFIGSKFFKLKFLNENKIRFNENLTEAELKFLIDAFTQTERLVFTPQLFYGNLKSSK